MSGFDIKNFGTFGSGIVAVFALALVAAVILLLAESNVPSPTSTSHVIAADRGFETVIVGSAQFPIHRTWRLRASRHYFPPKTVSFESTNGPVKIYAAPISLAYRKDARNHIEQLKKEFADGQVPKEVVAQATGKSGTLNLPDTRGKYSALVHFLVLIRSPNENQVSLTVEYRR